MGIAARQTENSFITNPIIYGQSVRQSTIYSFVCSLNSVCKIVVLCLFHSSHSVEKYKIGYSNGQPVLHCAKLPCESRCITTGSESKLCTRQHCEQTCNSGANKCSLQCLMISNQVSKQICNRGECDMKCCGQHCEQTCNSGANKCSLQSLMTSNQVSKQICNRGECDMKCRGQHCEQTCNSGANKCSLQCLMTSNQVCKQICNGGDCTLECHGSNCSQQCNGNQRRCQPKCQVATYSNPCEQNCFADESKCTSTATTSKKTTLAVALTTASQSPCRHYSTGEWLNK